MIKKMIQHGNNAAIVIDKPIMELLDFDIDTPLEISTDGKSLIISPIANENRMERLNVSLLKINKMHGKTLARLAK
ncbi:MAG TPA: AbrB/MazE/SpoVT family DNA-binding domain-containing protein [Candidatus Kapabacteria bacterium]|nr:AbrB/MazE/SpoVT family DNA-binding domain-containing protein [Candidatus Kapabacteria bacterium]